MALFRYPKTIHRRTLSPGPFKRYKTYKKYLRKEFEATCVYCRMPDRLSERNYYAVKHYKPIHKFPELEVKYSNLFYSCGTCNTSKGKFWPDEKQRAANIFVTNPCDHQMHKHLRILRDGIVEPSSTAGRWTTDLLLLNEPSRIDCRIFYLNVKKKTEHTNSELQNTLNTLKKEKNLFRPIIN